MGKLLGKQTIIIDGRRWSLYNCTDKWGLPKLKYRAARKWKSVKQRAHNDLVCVYVRDKKR